MLAHRAENIRLHHRYQDRDFGKSAVKILPGSYYVTGDDMLIVTVLGSCVSVCLHDSVNGVGGMNHFMLPEHGGDPGSHFSGAARYGAYAMEVLINDMLKLGAERRHFTAKVFGAGKVLSGVGDIGQRNAVFALDYLQREKISLLAKDLGDVYPRKVYLFPQTGRVVVRLLRNIGAEAITTERTYSKRIDSVPVGGVVDLF